MEATTRATVGRRLDVPRAGPLDRLCSDQRLVARFQAGDDGAFGAIYRRHWPRVQAICLAVLGSLEDAQDAAQEVFASAARTLRRRPPDELQPWLARVARNAAIDVLRTRRPTCAEPAEPVAPARADSALELREVLSAVRALPEQQRTALLMRELGGFSYAEIANALETDEAAVNGLIARARLGMRSREEALALACARVRERLAAETDGRRRPAELRRHLRACAGCREFRSSLRADTRALRALFPGGGLGLWQLAALWRAPRAAVLGGAAGQAAAGSQVAKLATVCAVCLGTAGGVGGLALAPPGSGGRERAGAPDHGAAASGGPAPSAPQLAGTGPARTDGWAERWLAAERRRALDRLRRRVAHHRAGVEPGWVRAFQGAPRWDAERLRQAMALQMHYEALKREYPRPQPVGGAPGSEPPPPPSPAPAEQQPSGERPPSTQAPPDWRPPSEPARPAPGRPERSRPASEPAPGWQPPAIELPARLPDGFPQAR